MKENDTRCPWCLGDLLMEEYHDREWGVPVFDDKILFEYFILDTFQAGLSWRTILHKRENFRKAFNDFDANKIARYGEGKIQSLMNDKGIIRNRLKINGAVKNARSFLKIQQEEGAFSDFLWQFTDGKVIRNSRKTGEEVPARTALSDRVSKELKKRGFTFCGSTICYAFLQASGIVNDHLIQCPRYEELK